jgi:hypothetical protein
MIDKFYVYLMGSLVKVISLSSVKSVPVLGKSGSSLLTIFNNSWHTKLD